MNNKIKACVVGLGRAGRFHLNSIKIIDDLELLYVVDTNQDVLDEITAQYKCTPLTTIDAALADEKLDAVIIASPTDTHLKYIQQSLKAGKHVLTEKPLGHNLADIVACFDLAATNNLALFLGFQRRYDKNFIALKQKIGQLGDCRIVKASSRDNPKPSLQYLKISGNIFHDMLIHDFDMLTFLFGTKIPNTVYATGYSYDANIKAIPDYDTVLVTLTYPDGQICSIDTSRISAYGYDQRLEVFGEHGMAFCENEIDNTVKVYKSTGLSQDPFNYSFPQRYKAAYLTELEAFADGIKQGILNNVSKQECMLGHLIADAALVSANNKTVVNFEAEYGDTFLNN